MIILTASVNDLSKVVCNVLGGVLYNAYGGPTLFRCTAVFAGGWAFVLTMYYQIEVFRQRKQCVGDYERVSESDVDVLDK